MSEDSIAPLPLPPEPPRRTGAALLTGLSLLPENRIKAFAPDDLELLVKHWLHERVASTYARVARYAGPGDQGRDVIGFHTDATDGAWDNYQCKRYANALTPSDAWLEFGKLVFYVSNGAYTVPDKYVFVSPKGCGPKLRNLLDKPEDIRAGLLGKWDKECAELPDLSDREKIIESFTFPRFSIVTAEDIVEDLKGTRVYPVFFGGGLTKPRPPVAPPPDEIADKELPYIEALVGAYDEHCHEEIAGHADAFAHGTYGPHLRGSRKDFYCAESLREFSKDVLTEADTFEGLQEEIFDGVRHTIGREYATGYDRVLATCEQATSVQVSDHPLKSELRPADRAGMCHQLANDGRVSWKKSAP